VIRRSEGIIKKTGMKGTEESRERMFGQLGLYFGNEYTVRKRFIWPSREGRKNLNGVTTM